MNELKKCLEKGVYLSFGTTYHFVEKNWHRSIGNAIQTLQEIGYEIIHENRSYAYVSKNNRDIYAIAKAIRNKQLVKFDYRRKEILDKSDFIEQEKHIKGKSYEEAMKIMDDYEYERDIVVSPYDIIDWKLLCGKKSGKDSEKTYDFFVYKLSRIENIRIEKTSNNSRYYSFEKACAKLPKTFFIDTEDYESEQILRKNIALFKTYEIGYYEKNLFEELSKKFTDVVNIERKNAKKYYTQFTHFDEDDVFNYIRQINTEDRNIRFKKEQQKRYEEWLENKKRISS